MSLAYHAQCQYQLMRIPPPQRSTRLRLPHSIPRWVSLAWLTILGCADAGGPRSHLTVFRDSAGIRIAENESLPEALVWRELDESRVVLLGGAEDGPLFWRVRDVTRLRSGRIAVLNAGSHEVFVFESDGSLFSRFGREGDGPGEFRLPFAMLGLTEDSIAVVDATGRRTLFGRDGEYVGQFNTRLAGSGASSFIPDTPLPDGSVVARADLPTDRPTPSGPYRRRIRIARVDSTGSVVADFGTYGDLQQEEVSVGGVPLTLLTPFTPSTFFAAGGVEPLIVVGDSDRPELRVFDLNGSLRLLIRTSSTRAAVTQSDMESWKETRRAAGQFDADRARQMETAWRNLAAAEFKPAFGRPLGVTSNGFVWVANHALYPTSSNLLWVFDREGGFVGTVRLPAVTGPWPHQFELGEDYLLVVVFDDAGVESVRYYPLREPSPT